MKRFKYFLSLIFILFSQNVFAQEITLVWGDTLSKLIFQYHDRNLSNWKEILPLYLSLNPQIKNPDLIYAEDRLVIPSQEEMLAYLNSHDSLGFDDIKEADVAGPRAFGSQRHLSSLVDHVASPWSLELQAGPYLKYSGSTSALEYTSENGFDLRMKGVYHLNDKYAVGISSRYSRKAYQPGDTNIAKSVFPLKGAYLESYMNWHNFIVSAFFGVRERLVYDGSNALLTAQHFDYGVGLHYRLIKGQKWEGLVGLNAILFAASTSLPEGVNQKGYDVKARAIFNYNFWENHLVGLESVYSLSQGKSDLYDASLEDFVTRLSLQFNF